MPKLKIQYISDYHSEWLWPKEPFKEKIVPTAPVLILAGDMVSAGSATDKYVKALEHVLEYVSENYKLVIYVPGNHEYYNYAKSKKDWLTIPQVDARLRKLCSDFKNVKFLNNNTLEVPILDKCGNILHMYKFIGSTLWGYIPDPVSFSIEAHKNDFYQISLKSGTHITVPELNKLHQESVKFIDKEIKKAEKNNETAIVITHHQPYITKNDFCFHDMSIDTMNLLRPPVKLWIMGHMHKFRDLHINGVRICENALGYKGESTGYKKSHYILV